MVQRRSYSNQEFEINSDQVEEKEEKNEKVKNIATDIKECKVLSNSKNKTTVDFDGYGITIDGIFSNSVKVEYTGQIGKSNFKIINII